MEKSKGKLKWETEDMSNIIKKLDLICIYGT